MKIYSFVPQDNNYKTNRGIGWYNSITLCTDLVEVMIGKLSRAVIRLINFAKSSTVTILFSQIRIGKKKVVFRRNREYYQSSVITIKRFFFCIYIWKYVCKNV